MRQRWSSGRISPPVAVAFVTSIVILVGFIAFLVASSRPRQQPGDVNITVGGGPTPTTIAVGVTVPGSAAGPTLIPTVVPPPAMTSAPLATIPPVPTLPPTATRPALPPTLRPEPTLSAAAAPAPAAPAPPETQPAPPPEPAAQAPAARPEPTPPPPLPAPAPPLPAPPPPGVAPQPAPPLPPPQGQASNLPPVPTAPAAPAPQPAAKPPAAPNPTVPLPEPSPRGGIGNTRRDFESAYGPPIGRAPDGSEVFRTNRAELQVSFRDDRAERLRLKLFDEGAMPLDEARNLARGMIPRDATPTATSGDAGQPVDQFNSAMLARAIPPIAGQILVRYTPGGQGTFSGFEIVAGS